MVGHYLLTLTAEQEDRVLTRAMEPQCSDARTTNGLEVGIFAFGRSYACGCLVMTARDNRRWDEHEDYPIQTAEAGYRYEDLCERFSIERVNAAIRNRILSNKSRRALSGVERSEATAG